MTKTENKTYLVGVIERAVAYYKVEAEDARTAAQNWQDGEFRDRDDEALESEGPTNVREKQADGSWLRVPPSEWEANLASDGEDGEKPYSVLLLYPDYANDGGKETFYAFVKARDPIEAVLLAQRRALAVNEWEETEPEDFAPLLVTEGHHYGQPLFNK